MKTIYSCLLLSAIIYSSISYASVHYSGFAPISWAFKSGEKAKIVSNTTNQVYYIQISVQTGGVGITIDGQDSTCNNLHLNENGLNTAICKFGANNMLYIDNDNEYGLASGTYQIEK